MTDLVQLNMERRDERALAMRVAGKSIGAIARTFGWTEDVAQEAIERALVRVTVERDQEGVAHMRALTEQRLDALLESVWGVATDTKGHPVIQQNAVKTALNIIDRQTRQYGTDAPREVTVTHSVGPDEVAGVIERLFQARSGVVEAPVLQPAITGEVIPDEPDPDV